MNEEFKPAVKTPRLVVERYKYDCGYKGNISPETREWIVFLKNDGTVEAWNCNPSTGGVIGEPAILKPINTFEPVPESWQA
jgi:hypothetical protein